MELLILLALSTWGFTRYASNTAVTARRKAEPLRIAERRQRATHAHQRHQSRMKRRNGRPTIAEAISIRIADRIANPRGGPARQAMSEWWSDSWGYATERRRNRHDRAAAGQHGRQKAARAARGWVQGRWAAAKGKPRAGATGGAQTAGPADAGGQGAGAQQPAAGASNGATTGTPNAGAAAAGGREASDRNEHAQRARVWAGAEVIRDDDVVDAEVVAEPAADVHRAGLKALTEGTPSNEPPTPPTPPQAADTDPAGTQPAEHNPTDDHPLASVHPINRGARVTTTTHNINGETLDPGAGKAFADQIGSLLARVQVACDQSHGSLTKKGLDGPQIQRLGELLDAVQVANSKAEALSRGFDGHINTRDVVNSDADLRGAVRGTYLDGANA